MKQAGRRPHLVRVQQAVTVTDDYGGESKTWHDIGSAWAEYFPGSGQERRQAAQENASITAVFNFDWSPMVAAIVPTDRLYVFDTVWDVERAVVMGANEQVDVTATANLDAEIDS